MKDKIRNQKKKIVKLEVRVDELNEDMKEIKLENEQLRFIVRPDY